MERDGAHFMLPFVVGATTLLGGLAILELVSRGQIKSIDNSADIYFALVGAYATAGELRRWMGGEPEADPWLERARKGGAFVSFWLILYTASLLWRVKDGAVPMPHELKGITLRTIGVFFVAYSSRRIRHAKRGGSDSNQLEEVTVETRVLTALQKNPDGLTRRQLTDQLSDVHERKLRRTLAELLKENRLRRDGHPFDADARYSATQKSDTLKEAV